MLKKASRLSFQRRVWPSFCRRRRVGGTVKVRSVLASVGLETDKRCLALLFCRRIPHILPGCTRLFHSGSKWRSSWRTTLKGSPRGGHPIPVAVGFRPSFPFLYMAATSSLRRGGGRFRSFHGPVVLWAKGQTSSPRTRTRTSTKVDTFARAYKRTFPPESGLPPPMSYNRSAAS